MKYLLLLPGLPIIAATWAVGFLTVLLGLARAPRFEGVGVLGLEWREWFIKIFPYSFTLLHTIFYYPGARNDNAEIDTQTERHEHVHTRQFQDNMFISTLLGFGIYLATGDEWLSGAVWFSGCLWQLCSYATAAIRWGRHWYRDSEIERAAYAQTDMIHKDGYSWLELRAAVRNNEQLKS